MSDKTANDTPIFKSIFGASWDALPPVMKQHYAVRANSEDVVTVKGTLDIRISPLMRLISKCTGMLLSQSGNAIPTTVMFRSGKHTNAFYFDRTFHFPDKGDITFRSRMEQVKDNIVVEFMRFGIGWKLAYSWDGEKVILAHRGYVWRVFGVMIPLPATWLIGAGHAEEIPLSDTTFRMWTHAKSPLLGETFYYAGEFEIVGDSCNAPS